MTEFKTRMQAGEILAGTFVKTPALEMIEVLALSGLDFVCIDAEHAPFDRARLDACLAVARALGFACLVRVSEASPVALLQVLDAGAAGVIVPHVDSAATAARIAKTARFGHGGRGFAGSTRSAGYGTLSMAQALAAGDGPVVIAQIEDPEGVEACEDIAATDGIDGVFLGPADLSVSLGKTDQSSPELMDAVARVGAACKAAGKAYMTFTPSVEKAAAWRAHGFTVFFVASEQAWILQGARSAAAGIKSIA